MSQAQPGKQHVQHCHDAELLCGLDRYLRAITEPDNIRVCRYALTRDIDTALSRARLADLRARVGDIVAPKDVPDNDNRIVYHDRCAAPLAARVGERVGCEVKHCGFFWYPYRGFSGWHTNSNLAGERIYLVWSQEAGRSFFRYRDPQSRKIITHWHPSGWEIIRFGVVAERQFWHCVGSYTNRVSIGFRVLDSIAAKRL